MLSVFHRLFDYSFAGPTLLRLALGSALIAAGIALIRDWSTRGAFAFESVGLRPGARYALGVGALQVLLGAMLIIGLFTQIAATAAAIFYLIALFASIGKPGIVRGQATHYLLAAAVALSLLVLGPGMLSVDLPL